jgi:hypothetical protein
VEVTLDTSEVPELASWGAKAKGLVATWHPIIAERLKSDGFSPPAEVTLVFKKRMRGIAYASGTTITIAADWVGRHPDDFGMVIHELAHVVQSYPRTRQGWLVEGIADYIRFFHYEPEAALGPIDPRRASYRDGYRTTARFLAWIERTHDGAIVGKLNEALRRSRYEDGLFKEATSRDLDALWAEFLEGAGARGR